MAFANVKKDLRAAANEAAAKRRENYRATQGRNIRRRNIVDSNNPQWQKNLDREVRKFGSTAGTMLSDAPKFPKKGIDYLLGQFPSAAKYIGMLAKGITRHGEEVDAASRDYEIPPWKGGNPIAVDKASPAHKFLLDQMEDKDAFREAVGKDRVFWGDLERMSGDKYDASHPGLIALLNDPSRLDKMKDDPIRALNYMRSITGDPSNMGFDEFEALRQSQPEVYGGLTATEIAQELLPQYRQTAADMYGQGFIADKAREYVDTTEPRGLWPNKYKDTSATEFVPDYSEPNTLEFVGGNEMLEDYAAQQDGIVRGLQESDVDTFDPYLNPSFPFYGGNRQKYMNYLLQSGNYDQ